MSRIIFFALACFVTQTQGLQLNYDEYFNDDQSKSTGHTIIDLEPEVPLPVVEKPKAIAKVKASYASTTGPQSPKQVKKAPEKILFGMDATIKEIEMNKFKGGNTCKLCAKKSALA